MRKLMICAFLIMGSAMNLMAQSEAQAKTILAEVSKKYRSYDVIKTDFSYSPANRETDLKQTQTGTLYVKSKANKYQIILKNQELISDGKNQWTYLKADKEVQLREVDNSSDGLNPAGIFTIYEKGFKMLYTDDSKLNGRTVHNIDLTPIDSKRSFFKVRLQVDKLNKQISNATIFDKNGNKYTYS